MQLTELVAAASEQAIESMESTQGPLTTFTLLLRPNVKKGNLQVTVTKFASEFPEQSLEHAQASLRANTGILMYALASPSSVTINGRAWEAVLIECGTPESEEGEMYAQCYEQQQAGLFKKKIQILPFGEPFLVSKCASRLWTPEKPSNQSLDDWHWVGELPEEITSSTG
jgi:hypothetical protein